MNDENEMIKRLRASREATMAADRKQGFDDGEAFLENKHDDDPWPDVAWFENHEELPIRDALLANPRMDWVHECEMNLDPQPVDLESYWRGFREGVLKLWNSVRHEVEV